MTKGAIPAANQAKKEQLIQVGQHHKMVMKSDRKRMQKEEEMEKQTKINAGAVKTSNCMDVDLAFSTNTTHNWGIHSNGINAMQTEEEPSKDINKRKEMKNLNNSFTTLSAIIVQEAEEYKNCDMPDINKSKEEDREMKKSLMKKLRLSWMGCSKQ